MLAEEREVMEVEALPENVPSEEELAAELRELERGPLGDSVRMYLREIGKIPLLKAAEERELAKRAADGLVAAAALQQDKLSPEQRRGYQRQMADGDLARRQLVEANLRLVVSVAKRYLGRGMSLLDLIQEGNLGLMRAVEKFDYSKGYKLSTYAMWWIRQSITRAIADQSRTIRIPVHVVDIINKVARVSRRMLQEQGREATPEEIGLELGLTADEVREIAKISQTPVSLEMTVGEEDDSALADFIPDENLPAAIDVISRKFLGEQVKSALDSLSEHERNVLRMRFGLGDGEGKTLEEVGRAFRVTRERIRQIEARALRKLRNPERTAHLKGYLDSPEYFQHTGT